MASVSGATSSLGNTSLRGYGGLASGIDRDEMIESMTAGTKSKIESQKGEVTKLQWKQEAYRNIIDQIIDIEDTYFSFTSGSNLKSSSLFAKNIISTIGDDDVTKFVKASGTSAWVDNLSIQAVDQLATAATQMSAAKNEGKVKPITTQIKSLSDTTQIAELAGKKLEFGILSGTDGKFNTKATFTFPTSYTTDEGGKQVTKYIDYTQPADELVKELNKALEQNEVKLDGQKLEFTYKEGNIGISFGADSSANKNYSIRASSSALSALGYDAANLPPEGAQGTSGSAIKINDFNAAMEKVDFKNSYKEKSMAEFLTGKTLTVSYGGQTKTIDLIKSKEEAASLLAKDGDSTSAEEKLAKLIQSRIDKAFGSGKVTVAWGRVGLTDGETKYENLTFKNADPKDNQTLTINMSDVQTRTIMGIEKNQSNKLTVDASLWASREDLGFDPNVYTDNDKGKEAFKTALENFSINGVEINGISADTTINELIDKINSTKDVGVKASYLSGSNKFLLVASETGKGRQIDLGASSYTGTGEDGKEIKSAAATIFGSGIIDEETGKDKGYTDGQDAIIQVNYGNGITEERKSSTNTFDIEGLKVTVSGEFGRLKDDKGNKIMTGYDTSQTVSFSAKADVDKATEKVKAFFEAYNKMVEQVGLEVRTRPDKSYGPLTDAQKEEMDEKSIENWENKAKEGILFNDSAVQNFSTALEGIMVSLMRSGVSYTDLEKIGITMSDDYLDGGKIVFDEAKFKSAMESEPELVSNIFTGGGGVRKGLIETIEDTLTPYATRYRSDNGNSYGRLIEEAGSEKVPLSVSSNWIYNQLKQMEETINTLKSRLKTEQDQYIKQFTTMESMINKFNSQSSYLSQFQG